jgi:hypothetical protein
VRARKLAEAASAVNEMLLRASAMVTSSISMGDMSPDELQVGDGARGAVMILELASVLLIVLLFLRLPGSRLDSGLLLKRQAFRYSLFQLLLDSP